MIPQPSDCRCNSLTSKPPMGQTQLKCISLHECLFVMFYSFSSLIPQMFFQAAVRATTNHCKALITLKPHSSGAANPPWPAHRHTTSVENILCCYPPSKSCYMIRTKTCTNLRFTQSVTPENYKCLVVISGVYFEYIVVDIPSWALKPKYRLISGTFSTCPGLLKDSRMFFLCSLPVCLFTPWPKEEKEGRAKCFSFVCVTKCFYSYSYSYKVLLL